MRNSEVKEHKKVRFIIFRENNFKNTLYTNF